MGKSDGDADSNDDVGEAGYYYGQKIWQNKFDHHYPRPVVWFYWVQAGNYRYGTDLAEFIGAAIGFKLMVLGVSLLQGAVLTGIATPDPDAYSAADKNRWKKSSADCCCLSRRLMSLNLSSPSRRWANGKRHARTVSANQRKRYDSFAGVLGRPSCRMSFICPFAHSASSRGTRKERYNATRWDVAIAL